MKKVMILVTLVMVVVGITGPALAKSQQDAVLVGKHLNSNPVVLYQIRMGIDMLVDGLAQFNEVNAWMEPDGNIIRIEIDGDIILDEDDPPVQSLPRPIKGEIVNAWLGVYGYDKTGNDICDGFDYVSSPEPGHRFNIDLWVNLQRFLLKPENPNGIPVNDTYLTINGHGMYQYDWEAGGYWVYLDPTMNDQTYAIWYNSQIVASGIIDVSGNPDIPETEVKDFSLGFNLPSDVEVVDLSQEQYEITFKGLTAEKGETTLVSGEIEKAKVFSIIRRQDSVNSYLSAWITRLSQVSVTVFATDDQGQLVRVGETVLLNSEGNQPWMQIYFNVNADGHQNFILVFTDPVYKNLYNKTFEVTFGGGKG